MNERPIIFSSPMIIAIREGKKTQTRRVVIPQPVAPLAPRRHCPHELGSRLWVRETWGNADFLYGDGGQEGNTPFVVAYQADKVGVRFTDPPHVVPAYDLAQWNCDKLQWKPSIFMPRWASRLTLEITQVRAERVQDISQEDCLAEGIEPELHLAHWAERLKPRYQHLWDAIHAKRYCPWDSKPFVWVLTVKVVENRWHGGQ